MSIDKEPTIYYYIVVKDAIISIPYGKYKDYIEREQCCFRENVEEYTIIKKDDKLINNSHDKTYRKMLGNKNNVAYIINKALKLDDEKAILSQELQKYNSSFITSELRNSEADIVYKLKGKNVFFLIEHQTKQDYSIPYRIKEYIHEIEKSAIDLTKLKKRNYDMPEVIPIVIYTGETNWKVSLYLKRINDDRLQDVNLTQYNIIDINNYTKDELLESNNIMDKIFLLEKTKDAVEVAKTIETIISQIRDDEDKQHFTEILNTVLRVKIGDDKANEYIKKLKGEKKDMLAIIERVKKENSKIRKEGIKEGMRKAAREMKNNELPIELIEKVTGLSKSEIFKIK